MTDLLGRYGVLRLLSNKTRKPVTSFPVDSDVLTFGRDTTCDVRMYFTFVSPLHAKLVFENGQVNFKAFLSVMGMQGIVVNGSVVMPSSRSGEPIILPLQDQAEFTIHNKTFRFEYPSDSPHPFRVETPPRKSRKSLRMSMINAARVISPDMKVSPLSPSLEVLQSPIKPYGDVKSSAERDLEVILAEGDDVTVSKQGNDLVIVESIGDSDHDKETEDFKSSSMDFIRPQREQSFAMETPRTPTRPKTPTSTISTLHKAVLVRNSRLAMIDREDEEEVFKAVSPERNSPPEEEEVEELDELEQDSLEEEGNPVEHTKNVNDASYPENEEDEPIDQSLVGEGQDHEYHEAPLGCSTSPRPSLLRASLGAIGNVLAAPFSITWDASESEPAEQPQDVAHRDASGVVAPEEKQDETPGSLLDHSMETVEDEEYPPVTESETEPPNHLDESDPHSPSPASQIGFPSPSRAPLSPTKPRSQSLETGVSETTLLARRNRNSAFGLPERWIRNAAPEPNERPEESNLPDNTPIQPATFSTPVKVASFTAPFTAIPSSTPLNSQPSQTPTLESLRKQAQKFEIDNANRATRLSFGHTPTLLRFQSPSKQYAEARRLLNIDGHEYPEESEEAASSTSESASDTSESPVIAALSTMDASGLATPTRHHSQPSSQLAPKTPSFAGFRSLFAPVPREAATPSYQGMRKMFQIENPQAVPPTPSFAGMNDIFTQVEVAEIEDIVQGIPFVFTLLKCQ
ncbi:uncharacterized protein EI90DRAFT_639250 [Cantharellus anzutake]|uniref:uncharacterized protein n=1 Tax=Cantharellus anzutake TaxID=1750568 RepID=UPI0019056CD5|nr:uncharacterized protein EI90DRAFT_639250 [Cantharellus anzutake]KAF8333192.1 hypothetical protein EI90DRAFT_639250 [Cantharellus anzutake]